MSARRSLSEPQRQALLQLHVRWRWGIDHRKQRGLLTRRLISLQPYTFQALVGGRVVTVMLPWLTPAGEREAARLWLALPAENKQAVRTELARWGLTSDARRAAPP